MPTLQHLGDRHPGVLHGDTPQIERVFANGAIADKRANAVGFKQRHGGLFLTGDDAPGPTGPSWTHLEHGNVAVAQLDG